MVLMYLLVVDSFLTTSQDVVLTFKNLIILL